jgi:nucleotide-binding universal stress UspA family protein
MNTILIPTDFSETAQKAFEYAHTLFGSGAKYVLLNTYVEPRSSSASMISLSDILHEGSVDALADELAMLKSKFGDDCPDIQTVSEYGEAIGTITKMANIHKANLIVMGTTGATGLKEVMLGSVASGVIQHAQCAVIAVPAAEKYGVPKNILMAADLKSSLRDSSAAILTEICGLAKATVTVLTVEDPNNGISEEEAEVGFAIHSLLSNINHEFDTVKGDDVEMAISRYADMNDIDMIVTIPRKEGWISRIFNPSVSKKLAQHEYRPLLALAQ